MIDIYEDRAIFYRPERAFDHGLPDVPVHAFYDELDQVLSPTAATGSVPLDLSDALYLPYAATTPLFLARYCVIRAAETLPHCLAGTGELHYVLRGSGVSTNGQDEIRWDEGDCFCFSGGRETAHRAAQDALLFTVTNEPELRFTHTAPLDDPPVTAAVFRAARIDAELEAVHGATGRQKTAGKSVSFTTPSMNARLSGALMPSMMVAINSLEPGGVQRRHRHNSVAITVSLGGDGMHSLIGNEKVQWRTFGAIVTPPRLAHSHFNVGADFMRSLVIQDGPVFYNCRSVGFEWTEDDE
jgi:gentisate 1,2-dioxygenase